MRLLITGASGFLGRHVVAEALRRGHSVRALVRPRSKFAASDWSGDIDEARADLRAGPPPSEIFTGVEAVIHLAADKSGDLHAQFGSTVGGTEKLVQGMAAAGLKRLVLTSSFSVYDYTRIRMLSVLDEASPVAAHPEARDAYCWTKLLQEQLVRREAEAGRLEATILRPGVIFGPGELWTARLGFKLSDKLWIRTGAWSQMPLSYVENCAEAVVLAAETDAAIGATLNVLDDDTPTQRRLCRILAASVVPTPRIVPVAFSLMRGIAGLGGLFNRFVCGGRAKIPQILKSESLMARCKPLRYSNAKLKETLGWTPHYGLDEALARSTTATPPYDDVLAKIPTVAAGAHAQKSRTPSGSAT